MAENKALDSAINEASHGEVPSAEAMVANAQSGTRSGRMLALEAFDNLTNKIVLQEIRRSDVSSIYTVWRRFLGSKLIGNGKEYVKMFAQGMAYPSDVGSLNYVPNRRFDRTPVAQTMSNPVKKQFKLTMTGEELISKMVSVEKLEQLIAEVVNTLTQEIDLYMTHVMYQLLSDTRFQKDIPDTQSTSAYYCAREIGKYLKQASSYRNDFIINPQFNTVFDCWRKEDVIMFINQITMNNFELGLSPVLFNPQKTGFNNLNVSQVIEMPATQYDNVYVEGTHEEPTFTNTPYISENSVICISKNAITFLPQVEKMATQRFINNLTDLYVYDFWYIADVIGFELGFKYTCDNLNKTPEEADV